MDLSPRGMLMARPHVPVRLPSDEVDSHLPRRGLQVLPADVEQQLLDAGGFLDQHDPGELTIRWKYGGGCSGTIPELVNIQKAMERSTMFHGKTHYKW